MKGCLCCLIGFLSLKAGAQPAPDTLIAFGFTPGLYVYHTVRKEENYFSLGRMFGIPALEVAKENHLSFDHMLPMYSFIRIPLDKSNFIQGVRQAPAGYRPVFHRVLPGETLYHISRECDQVPEERIRVWNRLSGNILRRGSLLVIGFVRYELHSRILTLTPAPSRESARVPFPVASQDRSQGSGTNPGNSGSSARLPAPISSPRELEQAPVHPVSSNPAAGILVSASGSQNPFEEQYLQQMKQPGVQTAQVKGAATWFASNIPAGSRKYYVLFDSCSRGEVVRITNLVSGNFIYARVLDQIPKLGENAGIVIRISDAARKDLGVNTSRFYAEVDYIRPLNTSETTEPSSETP